MYRVQPFSFPPTPSATMPPLFEDPEDERRFLEAGSAFDDPEESRRFMEYDFSTPVTASSGNCDVEPPLWPGFDLPTNSTYISSTYGNDHDARGSKHLRVDSAFGSFDRTTSSPSLGLPQVPTYTSTTSFPPYFNQPSTMPAGIPGIDFVFGQPAPAQRSVNLSVAQPLQLPRVAHQQSAFPTLLTVPSAQSFTQSSTPRWGAPTNWATQAQHPVDQANSPPQMTAPIAVMVPQTTIASGLSAPPSTSATVKMLPLTDPTTFKVGGKHDRLVVNGLRRDVQPLTGYDITLEEINIFNPHWALLTEPTRRFMQNGLKPGPAAELQLTAGLQPLNAANKQKVVNRIKKQYSKVGLDTYGDDENGRWDVSLAEQEGSYDDLTANHWGESDGTTFGHIKLSDMYGPIPPQHWPTGNGRAVTTKCLEWARNNQQQFPDLTTQDWDWIIMQLGPLATTPATPAAYANLDEEAVARLGN